MLRCNRSRNSFSHPKQSYLGTRLAFESLENRRLLTCDLSLPGDINNDNVVDSSDFLILSGNYGGSVEACTEGDLDGDGIVGFPDFLILADNFGQEGVELTTVTWSKTLDILDPGAVWVGSGELSDGTPIDVRLFDFVLASDGTTVERTIFEISGDGRETVSLLMSGTFTPGDVAGTGAIALTGEQDSVLNSTTENGVITTSGTITYIDAETGEEVSATWSKTIDPFNPLAVWVGSGELTDGTPVDVRLFDFVPGSDGTTIEQAIFEVSGEGMQVASMRMSGEFTPGETAGTGSILMHGEQGSTLESTTENGLITTSGQISFVPEEIEDGAELTTVTWSKTLDILDPGAVWAGSGELSDGTPIDVRLFDFVLASDGTTVERTIFEISGDGRETVSLLMSGTFTPGDVAGTGAIALTGEQDSVLNSTTENGVITTTGTITYIDAETGEEVSATWSKTIDPFNPLAVWVGSGELTDGTPVDVRLFDFVPGSDGTTIEQAIFEVRGEGMQVASMRMSGEFTPGETAGTGSILMHGELGSTLESTTENGLITTSGQISFVNVDDLKFDEVTVAFSKTRQGESSVWSGPGETTGGEQVTVTATTGFDMLFEVIGPDMHVALPLTGVDECDRDVCFVGPSDAQLSANRLDGGLTFEGVISFEDGTDSRLEVAFSKTRQGDTFVWSGPGSSEGGALSVKATVGLDMLFAIMGSETDAALALTRADACEDGKVCFVGTQGAELVASTPDGGQTFEGEISFSRNADAEDLSSEFGPEDELGAANLLTAETIVAAAELITEGKTYSLAQVLDVDSPVNGFVAHELVVNIVVSDPNGLPSESITVPFPNENNFVALAEELTSNFMHVGTQFDGLGHIGIGELFFNGNNFEEVFTPTGLHRLGVENVPPFFTRGVLIDVAAAKGVDVLEPGYEITASDIELALDRQGMLVAMEDGRQQWDINPGDVVLIHTGWGSLYSSDPETFVGAQPGLGVGAARALAAHDVVMVGADNVFVDVFPNPDGLLLPVHQELLTRNGIYMMEVVNTEPLASDQVYEFAFSFAPIRVQGGTGSAAHPFAIV